MTTMNQDIINVLLGVMAATGGWVLRVIWQAMRDLQDSDRRLTENLAELREHLPQTYVTKEEFVRALQRIEEKLDLIFKELQRKQNRTTP